MIDTSKINPNNKVFCVAPWLSLNINQDGNIQPCCNSNLVFGDILRNDIKDVWNGEPIKKFRQCMIDQIPQESCKFCYEKEISGQKSLRQVFNESLFDEGKEFIYNTNDDYSVNEFGFIHWDVKLGNKCNFKCRSCGPSASSSIELEFTGKVSGRYDFSKISYYKIQPYLKVVNHLYFSGGEPLIMSEHYKLLDMLYRLDKHKDPNFRLVYNTNFSVLKYKKINILDVWSLFKYVQVHVSIDGVKKRGELIRHGFNWKKFVSNAKEFKERFKNRQDTHQLYFDCTVQALNVFDVVNLHQTLFDMELLTNIDNFHLNYLHGPRSLSVWILDKETKEEAKKNIQNHIDNFLIPNGAVKTISEFKGLINFIDLYQDQRLIVDFVDRMRYFDSKRGQSVFGTFPELKKVWEYYFEKKPPLIKKEEVTPESLSKLQFPVMPESMKSEVEQELN